MMYFDVPSSKMPEQRSNKVLDASNGPLSLAFVCPHTCQPNFSSSRNPKRKKCTNKISMTLAPWSPGPSSLKSPFQALFEKYTHTPPPYGTIFLRTEPISRKKLVSSSKAPNCPPPPHEKRHISIYVCIYVCMYIYIYMHIYIYIYVYICIYVCVCVCMYVYIYIYIYSHSHSHNHLSCRLLELPGISRRQVVPASLDPVGPRAA